MRKWLQQFNTLLIALLTVILTNLVAGEPPAGLTRLKALSQTFLKPTVPGWAFAAALFVAFWASDHLRNLLLTGKVHFVPDAQNFGWSRSDAQLEIRAGGMFTYEGKGKLIIRKAYLEGMQPPTEMSVQVVTPFEVRNETSGRELSLSRTSVCAILNVRLTPARGTCGEPLRLRLVLRDKYNRDFRLDSVDFPYILQQVPVNDKHNQ